MTCELLLVEIVGVYPSPPAFSSAGKRFEEAGILSGTQGVFLAIPRDHGQTWRVSPVQMDAPHHLLFVVGGGIRVKDIGLPPSFFRVNPVDPVVVLRQDFRHFIQRLTPKIEAQWCGRRGCFMQIRHSDLLTHPTIY